MQPFEVLKQGKVGVCPVALRVLPEGSVSRVFEGDGGNCSATPTKDRDEWFGQATSWEKDSRSEFSATPTKGRDEWLGDAFKATTWEKEAPGDQECEDRDHDSTAPVGA